MPPAGSAQRLERKLLYLADHEGERVGETVCPG